MTRGLASCVCSRSAQVAPGEPAGLTYSPSRPSPYHTTGHYASMQPMSPPDMAPGPLTAGGAPGPSPGARSLGAAAELDAELQALRAARAEYQRSVAASHEVNMCRTLNWQCCTCTYRHVSTRTPSVSFHDQPPGCFPPTRRPATWTP